MPRARRLRLPAETAAGLRLEPGERPLAWATDTSGHWYVGTDRALHLPRPDEGGFRALPWEQVERADWRQEDDTLAVVEVTEPGRPEVRTQIRVEDPGRLLELLQERVTKSVVSTSYTKLAGRQSMTVVARRSPTGQGPITWSWVLSRDLDPADPAVAEAMEQARQAAEAELRDVV